MKKINNDNKNLPNYKKIIITIILLVLILIVCGYNIIKLIKKPTNIFIVENGKLYQEEFAIGYVLRDEEVLDSDNTRNIVQIKTEGEKVAKDEAVYRYYSDNEEKLKNKILELDNQIQDAMNKQTEIYSGDIKILDKQIEERIKGLVKLNSIQEISEAKKDINSYIIKKAKMVGELSPQGSYLKKLIEQRSEYENQLNSGAEYINATEAGIVSYRIDGLEADLKIENYENLAYENLSKLDLKVGQTIATSNTHGKIINNFKCEIATILKSENAKNSKVGDYIKIRLSNNDEITAKISYKKEESDNSTLIVFYINKDVEKLIASRKISMDVIWWSYEGLKVPNSAILEEDDKTYVIRNRAGYTDKILIKVKRKNENYSIIDNYITEELTQMGYTTQEITEMKRINLHDEIKIDV